LLIAAAAVLISEIDHMHVTTYTYITTNTLA